MKLTIRPASRSTPERPRFVWHLWSGGNRPLRFGICDSPAECQIAAEAAEVELQARKHERRTDRFDAWLREAR